MKLFLQDVSDACVNATTKVFELSLISVFINVYVFFCHVMV